MTQRVRAELRRSGGFAGQALHIRADSAELPPADAARLIHLVSSVDFGGLRAGSRPAPPGADLMRYDLTVDLGERRWHGTFSDPSVPARLRPLIEFLSTR